MARPKKNTVDYFPHDCHPNRYLNILTSKFGNDGYAVYYRLNEVLGKTPNHAIPYGTMIDKEYLASETGVDIDKLNEILLTLVSIDYLNNDVWESSETIWSEEFVESISGVYDKRTTDLPTKYSFREENPSFRVDNSQSKVKKSKSKKSKEIESRAGSLLSLDEYQKLFPDKDIVGSYQKLSSNPNANHEMALNWFEREMRMRPPVFRKNKFGDDIAYCSKCGKKEFPNNQFQLKSGSSCCHVEYVPVDPKIETKRKKESELSNGSMELIKIIQKMKLNAKTH